MIKNTNTIADFKRTYSQFVGEPDYEFCVVMLEKSTTDFDSNEKEKAKDLLIACARECDYEELPFGEKIYSPGQFPLEKQMYGDAIKTLDNIIERDKAARTIADNLLYDEEER